MITTVEDYFTKGCGRCERFATPECSTQRWASGLSDLRRICLRSGLVETVKWGHPCYMHAERNIAILGAFRGDFRITFFNAALLNDPEGVLETPGPNTRQASMIRFKETARVAAMEGVIASYLKQAMGYAAAGVKAPKKTHSVELPDELIDALDSDPDLAEAFHALTPGRQKSYVINLLSTKSPATRSTRIAKFRAKILAGKGATDR